MITPKPGRRSGTPNPLATKSRPIHPRWQGQTGPLLPKCPSPDRSVILPKILRVMQANGSPQARFESDAERSSFLIRLPVHEGFAGEVAEQVTEEPSVDSR